MKTGLQVDIDITNVIEAWRRLIEMPFDAAEHLTVLLKKCILFLRVACVQGSDMQMRILCNDQCRQNIRTTISHKDEAVARSAWQLCSNLLVQCPGNVEPAIKDLLPLCLTALANGAAHNGDTIAAVLYNLLEANKLLVPSIELSRLEIYKCAIRAIYQHQEEQFTFLQFLLEEFLTRDPEPKEAYLGLDEQRINLHRYITEYIKSDVTELSSAFLRALSENFNRLSDNILTWFNGQVKAAEPEELLSLLECLCTITGTAKYSLAYKSEASMFINGGALLVACCESHKSEVVGKDKLSDFEEGAREEDPFYDFKSYLIRLIGNLAHKNKKNQDYVSQPPLLQLHQSIYQSTNSFFIITGQGPEDPPYSLWLHKDRREKSL